MDTIEALRLFVINQSSGSGPHRQLIAIRIDEVETSATRESEYFTADGRSRRFEPELSSFEVIGVQDDQRATRAHGFTGRETTGQATVAEFGVGRAILDEIPAEYIAIATGPQYHRASPGGRFLKRFMLHMYWLG